MTDGPPEDDRTCRSDRSDRSDRSGRSRRSRREVLALAGGTVAALAGCTSLRSPPAPGGTDDSGDDRPDTIFRADVARTGHWPDREVPWAVRIDWSIPGINKGDHTAAKPSPIYYQGDVILGGDVNTVFSYTPGGELNWATALQPSTYGTHATPAIADGRIFTTGYDGAVYAIDADTGEIAWRTKVADAIGSSPNYYAGWVYIATEYYTPSGGMAALDAGTGEIVWEDNRVSNHAHSQTGIDLDGRAFAAGSNDGKLYVWDLDSWDLRGTFDTGGPIKGPVCMHDGRAIFGSWDNSVYAVDTKSLEAAWTYGTGENVMSGPALHPDSGVVTVGSGDGHLHAINLDSGTEAWTYEVNGWTICSPVVAGDVVLLGDYSGTLHAVDVTDGSGIWVFDEPEGYITASPAVVDGDVYITERATSDSTGRLYKLTAA